jgi:GAF domain-containing protein
MNQTAPKSNPESPAVIFNYGRWREGFLQAMLIGSALFGFIALAGNYVTQASYTDLVIYSTAFGILLLTILIPFPYSLKAWVLLVLIYAIVLSDFWDEGIWGGGRLYMLVLVVIASILFSPRAGIIALIIATVTTAIAGWLILTGRVQLNTTAIPTGALSDWISAALTDILLSAVLIIGLRLVQAEFERARQQASSALLTIQTERKSLESRVEERTVELSQKSDLLRSAAFITRSIAEVQDVPMLLERAVQLISEHFGFDHAAIFLFNEERQTAFLQAASSEAGKRMMENGFQIQRSPRNAVGYVYEQNKLYVNTNTGSASRTQLISEGKLETMQAEVILPVSVRGRMLGILDLQSQEARTFQQDELEILQSLADQIAISVDSVRLINDTQAFANELEMLAAQQTGEEWQRYVGSRSMGYQYTPSGTKSIPAGETRKKNEGMMRIPLRLRGQDIGTMSFQGGEKMEWTGDEQVLAEKVAEQVSLALDNSRLLEETRQRAAEQQTVNEITARLNRSLDIDTLLQAAARELGILAGVEEVSVFIQPSGEKDQL